TVERQPHRARHVERGEDGGEDADRPQDRIATQEGRGDDLILRPEAGERWQRGERAAGEQHRPVGHRKLAPQAAHLPHVLLATENSGIERATRYTPAVTIVAAWIRADTGVGPSIASGSHEYSGSCADLPVAPKKKATQMSVRFACVAMPTCSNTSVNCIEPKTRNVVIMPIV